LELPIFHALSLMKLSIIITSYRSPELLKVCIEAIKKELSISDYEIIVADGKTEETTTLMMQEDYPEINFLPFPKNDGFGFLVRNALAKAQGDHILILNGDVIVKKDSIEKLLSYIQSHPEVGIVGPKLLNFNETFQPSCFKFYSPITILYRRTYLGKMWFAKKHLDNFIMKDFNHKSEQEVDWLMGSALMTSRQATEEVGPMDERFKMYFEDTDWCRRFWENNYKVVYFPDSEMYHYHGKGSDSKSVWKSLFSNQLTWIHIISAIKFFIKYAGKDSPRKK